uniref:Uncharacterized protein n=1 Tax=Arundo donax TaxID=35708 RepID=A0A0A9BFJ1_ARUDO
MFCVLNTVKLNLLMIELVYIS